MKKLLAIDTSTDRASVAIVRDDLVFTQKNTNIKQHAEFILPMIAAVMVAAELSFQDLDGIVFGCGPGSFTGIRVTCSIAKGLAYAHNLPLFAVTSLQAIAYAASVDKLDQNHDYSQPILVILDARMQEFYWQFFNRSQIGNNLPIGNPEVSSIANIKLPTQVSSQMLAANKLIIAGPNINNYASLLPTQIFSYAAKFKDIYPNALNMIKLVQAGDIQSISAAEALPLYVRNKIV